MTKRDKRMKQIQKRVKKYQGRKDLQSEQLVELMNDAIWLLDDFNKEWNKMIKGKK